MTSTNNILIVPKKFRVLANIIDANNDNMVSEEEINNAISILEKAKREKNSKNQKQSFTLYHNFLTDSYKNLL